MKTISIIAAGDFSHNGQRVAAGEVLGSVRVDRMTVGDIVSALRTGRAIEQRDDDDDANDDSDDDASPSDPPVGERTYDGDPYDPLDPDDRTLVAADVEDDVAAKYAAIGIHTVGELRSWLAEGHKLTEPNGIGRVTAAELTELLGL